MEEKRAWSPGALLPNKLLESVWNGGSSISSVTKAIGRTVTSLLQKVYMYSFWKKLGGNLFKGCIQRRHLIKKKKKEWQILSSSVHWGLPKVQGFEKNTSVILIQTLSHTQAAVSWVTSPYLLLLRAAVLPSLSVMVCTSALVCAGIGAQTAVRLDWKLMWPQEKMGFFSAKAAPWTDKCCADREGQQWMTEG